MKILLSAYSCLPTDGSEPAIGWNWARSIAASGHEVVVLTRAVGRRAIESHLETHPEPSIRFAYHDLPRPWALLYKLPLGNYAYYVLWQRSAAELASRMHLSEQFDRVQHITWGSFRVPSFMGRLGIPFTFGPVGGGEDTPPKLRRGLGITGRIWDALRRISSAMLAPAMQSTYAGASEIVTTTNETLNALPRAHRHKAWSRQAVGIDSELAQQYGANFSARSGTGPREPEQPQTDRLELLFVGRLLPWKGVHLALKALAQLGAGGEQVHLTVIGGGSDLGRLRRLATRLKVDGKITWKGWMPREEVIRLYSRYDLFLFPSLHDSGGMAVLEAMAFGLPVLCLDLGGPALAVNDRCGRVIATGGRDEDAVVDLIADFLREMIVDRAALDGLSQAARAQAATLTWQANADAVYKRALIHQAQPIQGAVCAKA
jgi:glycosyltransferase involved in cell wall biosynthesis